LQALFEKRREKQLGEHLDRFSLANAKIPGIGPTRIATLASHGVATAGDVVANKVLAVPGFGPTTVAKLTAWRKTREASFTFDPKRGVSASDQATVERDISLRRTTLERDVGMSLGRLKTAMAGAATYRQALQGKVAELGPRYAQALADVAVAPSGRQTHVRLLALSTAVAMIAAFSALSPTRTVSSVGSSLRVTSSLSPGSQPSIARLQAQVEIPPQPIPKIQSPDPTVRTVAPALSGQSPPTSQPGVRPPVLVGADRVTVKLPANVRVSADSNAQVVRTAPQGLVLKVFARNAGWVQVGEDEPWGWVFSGLVEKTP